MYSRAHALIGVVVSTLWVAVRLPGADLPVAAALVAYGVAVSVLVDLDHFLIARLYADDWTHLRRVLSDPLRALWDQNWVLEGIEDLERERLVSHAVVGTALVAGLWPIRPDLATFTAVLLAAHVLADVLRDRGLA